MKPRAVLLIAICLTMLFALTNDSSAQGKGSIRFDQFPVQVYRGHLKTPREFHRTEDGYWLDESGKPASPPRVNFAGEYYLAVHSCGTCCRYYTLNSLRTGDESNEVSMFASAEPAPRTKDGHTYVAELSFKPGSKLLIVDYFLDTCTPADKNIRRRRYFAFDGQHFKPLSHTPNLPGT